MGETRDLTLRKVPEVTLGSWIIKILATTLGKSGGDTVAMASIVPGVRSLGLIATADEHRASQV